MRVSKRWAFILSLAAFGLALAPAHCQASDQSVEDLLKRGKEAFAARNYAQAIKLFKSANKASHNSCGPCYLGLAFAYRGAGDVEKQIENAEKAIQYIPDHRDQATAHEMKGDAFLALAHQDPRKLKDAEEEFRTAAQLDNSNSVFHLKLGLALLKQSRDDEGKRELSAFLQATPDGPAAETAQRLIADPRRAREDFAPDFQVTTLGGENLELAKLAGKVVVLDFWATWCHPCVMGVPELHALVEKYPRDQLALISISADRDEGQWRAFIEKKHMEWPQYWDTDHRIRDLFAVRAFPTYVVIDKEGIIRQRLVGTNPQQTVAYRLKPILKTLLEPGGGS